MNWIDPSGRSSRRKVNPGFDARRWPWASISPRLPVPSNFPSVRASTVQSRIASHGRRRTVEGGSDRLRPSFGAPRRAGPDRARASPTDRSGNERRGLSSTPNAVMAGVLESPDPGRGRAGCRRAARLSRGARPSGRACCGRGGCALRGAPGRRQRRRGRIDRRSHPSAERDRRAVRSAARVEFRRAWCASSAEGTRRLSSEAQPNRRPGSSHEAMRGPCRWVKVHLPLPDRSSSAKYGQRGSTSGSLTFRRSRYFVLNDAAEWAR